ncbi:MAG TPA: WS/DGAT domain-containing protein [Aldersonia sp.]
MSQADVSALRIEHGHTVSAIGIAARVAPGGFVGPDGSIDLDALREHVVGRVAGIPRLRQRLGGTRREPRWVDCPVDITAHVRTGTAATLADLLSARAPRSLPRDLPLWELVVAPGPGVAFVVLRIHHAIADGLNAIMLLVGLFDGTSPPGPARVVSVPQRRGWRTVASGIHRTAVTMWARTPPTALLGPLGPRVGIGFAEVDLVALARGAESRGVTVNDALLGAVAAGIDALLSALREAAPPSLRVSVPVALPRTGGSGNRVGVMLAELPLEVSDPDARLRTIAEQTIAAKTDARSRGSLELVRSRIGMRLLRVIAARQRLIAGFVTNVPGPPAALSLAGAPICSAWPISGLGGNVRLAVAALSYNGRLEVTVQVDADALPVGEFTGALQAELTRVSRRGPQ